MRFFIQAIIFGLLNIISTRNGSISLVLCLVEYFFVYYCLIKGKTFESFLYYVLFTSLSIEDDAFVYGLDQAPFVRYSFFNFPGLHDWVYHLTTVVFFVLIYKPKGAFIGTDIQVLFKWLKLLFITGSVSIAIGICLNDNNIVGSGLYPRLAVSTVLRFAFLIMFLYICILYAQDKTTRYRLYSSAKYILVAVAISSIVGLCLGYRGAYGDWSSDIILSPMMFAFTPCLMLFCQKEHIHSYFYLFAALVVIIASISNPAYIGSKWYLIIAGSLFALIYNTMNIKSWKYGLVLLVVLLALMPAIGTVIPLLFNNNDFNSWKLMQAFGALNIFGYSDFGSWFYSLDDSAQFRLDELLNITIEYINKPFYLVFGKGLGGTTLHYTNFVNLDWTADASFSKEQIKNGFFYQMHETANVLYLRHGLLGIVFMFVVIKILFKRLAQNPWAMIGLLWFVFFWGWGVSFRLGALALCLAIAYNPEPSKTLQYEYHKDKV